MSLVLGLDLGTTNFKFGLFDQSGVLCGLGRLDAAPPMDQAGRCELPARDFWKRIEQGFSAALAQARIAPAEVVAASYATQANTFLLLDADHQPLTPLVFWPDRRAEELNENLDWLGGLDGFAEISGVRVDLSPQFAVAKLRWYQYRRPDLWARTSQVLTISDYLTLGLTGQTVGDAGSAALLGLLDARQGNWRPAALQACDLSAEKMAKLLAPGTLVGPAVGPVAASLGLKTTSLFAAGSMDHHVAALGTGVGTVGDCSESTGTVVACAAPVRAYTPARNVCLAPGIGPGYFAMTYSDNGAAALDWYRRSFAPQPSFEELLRLAAAVPAGCDGLRAMPCPHRRPGLEGFSGRKTAHGPGHFVRAILESVAESLAACVRALPADRPIRRILATGGGAKSDLWLQIKADHLGKTFVRPNCPEPACRGAAMLAAVAAGWFNTPAEASAAWSAAERTVQPSVQK